MGITNLLVVGNGEKCPYCEIIVDKDIDIVDHYLKYHKEQVINHLFDSDEYDK